MGVLPEIFQATKRIGRKGQIIDVLLAPATAQPIEPKSDRAKSVGTLVGDPCGANAPGGGGFQPGNDCAKQRGGAGGDNAGGVATAPRSRRDAMKEEILAAAEEIKFSSAHSDHYEGEVPAETLTTVEGQLTPAERDAMNASAAERAANYRENMAASISFDAEYHLDANAAYLWRKAGMSGGMVAANVGNLVADNIPDQRVQDAILSDVQHWQHNHPYGLADGTKLVDTLDAKLRTHAAYANNPAIQQGIAQLKADAVVAYDRAKDELRQQYTQERQEEMNDRVLRVEQGVKREWLSQLYISKPERFGVATASGDGVWYADGKFNFNTSAGTRYEIAAEAYEDEGQGAEITFRNKDAAGNQFKITGTGGAHEVFSAVVPAVVAYAQRNDSDFLTFTAHEPSRQRLYDRLVRTVSHTLPDYAAVATGDQTARRYIVYKREREAALQEAMAASEVPVEQLVKTVGSSPYSWRKSAFQLVASRWQKSRSDCGASGGPSGGFDLGNVCAVGEAGLSDALVRYRKLVAERQERRAAEAGGNASEPSQSAPVERPAPEQAAATPAPAPAAPPEPPRREISVQEAVDEALGPEPTAAAEQPAATPPVAETPVETPAPAPTPVDPNAPPMNRRERMRAEVLEAAKAVQFSDEPYQRGISDNGDFDPDGMDIDDIDERMAEHIGFDREGIRERVEQLITDHLPTADQNAALAILNEWDARGISTGVRMEPTALAGTGQIRQALESIGSPELDEALRDMQKEAEEVMAVEMHSSSVLYNQELRESRMRSWADENRALFVPEASDAPATGEQQKHGVWRPEGSSDAYKFQAPNGEEFTVYASPTYSEFTDGVVDGNTRDIRFANDSRGGTYGVTGEHQGGGARAVFSNVLPAVVAYLQEKQPDAIKFSAAKEDDVVDPDRPAARNDSRQRLYTRLVETIAETAPDYFAIATSEDHGETKYYIIAKREYKDEIMERAQQHDPNIEELVKSLRVLKSFMWAGDWQPWVLRKTLLRRTPGGRMKSTATLERDQSECGANAEGGGGFQPGNTCAAGGDGASAGGGTPGGAADTRQGARARMQKEILDAASKIKFSETPYSGGDDVDVSDLSDDDIRERMSSSEETQMEEYLNEQAHESISQYADEYVERNFEPDIDMDSVASEAGFDEDSIRSRVDGLIGEHVTDETQAAELREALSNWSGSGYDGVESLDNELASIHDIPPLSGAMTSLYREAESSMDEERIEQEDRQREDYRDSYIEDSLNNWEDYEARSEYLQDWARNNPENFASEGGEVEIGAWQDAGNGDSHYIFEASNGQKYDILASGMRAATLEGGHYNRVDVQFRNESEQSHGVTNTGASKEVFSNVVPAVVAYAMKHEPDVITFSAAKEKKGEKDLRDNSRQRLYDRLTRTVTSAMPGYFAVATKVDENDPYSARFYRIVKRENKEAFLAQMERTDPGYEVLVKSLSHLWSLPALRKSIVYRRTRRVKSLVKHLGPGDHPSGSPQAVHGSGGAGAATAKPSRGNISQVEAEGLASLMLRKGGFTYQPIDDNSPTSGYALSVFTDAEHVIQDGGRSVEDMSADIYGYLQQHRGRFEDAKVHVGGWHDVEAKKIYLDLSVVESDRQAAIDSARQHKQEAIFDLGEFQTIIVKDEHERRKTLRRLLRKTATAGAVRVVMTRPKDTSDAELQRVATAMAKGIARLEVQSLLAARRARRKSLARVKSSTAPDDCGANAQGGGGFQPGNTCAGGDGSSGAGGDAGASQKPARNEVDAKLHAHYDKVKPRLQAIVEEHEGQAVDVAGIDSWEQLDEAAQQNTQESWGEDSSVYYDFYESARESIEEDVRSQVENSFYIEAEVAKTVLDDLAGEYGIVGTSIEGAVNGGNGAGDDAQVDVESLEFDTDEQREAALHNSALEKAISDHIDDRRDELYGAALESALDDARDSIHESAQEAMSDCWYNGMQDQEKLDLARAYGNAPEDSEVELEIPGKYQPFTDGDDYKRTQHVARLLQDVRAKEIMAERGIADADKWTKQLHEDLWRGWKESSTSRDGKLLQLAAVDEFGAAGRPEIEAERATLINQQSAERYAAIKAYTRATWESSQYVLDQGGHQDVVTWRGLLLPGDAVDAAPEKVVSHGVGSRNTLMTEFELRANGAQSATTDPSVANSWQGVGPKPQNAKRVVLRVKDDRSSVLSIPAFGQNIHNEQEVILLGTPWDHAQAWKQAAPTKPDVAWENN